MKPIVTILLATSNRAYLIEQTLKSIQCQTYENFECFITDDKSTDNTKQIVESFCRQDDRFKYFMKTSEYEVGLSETRNFGLDLAHTSGAKYIQFCDDDDIMHKEHLACCLYFFQSGTFDFIHFRKQSFTNRIPFQDNFSFEDLAYVSIDKHNINDIIMGNIGMASCTVMWNLDVIGDQRFENQLYYAEEWEFYTRLMASGRVPKQMRVFN